MGFTPRVRGGSKRVDNLKIVRLLKEHGLQLQHPDYKSGLLALSEGDLGPFDQDFSSPLFAALPVGASSDTSAVTMEAFSSTSSIFLSEEWKALVEENFQLRMKLQDFEQRLEAAEVAQRQLKVILIRLDRPFFKFNNFVIGYPYSDRDESSIR